MQIERMTHLEDMKAMGRTIYLMHAKDARLVKGSRISFESHTVTLKVDPDAAMAEYIRMVRRDNGTLRDLIHGHLFDIGMRQVLYDLVDVEIFEACSADHPKAYKGKERTAWLAAEQELIKNTCAWLRLLNETWEGRR